MNLMIKEEPAPHEPPLVKSYWDVNACSLMCEITYGDGEPTTDTGTLSQALDCQFSIHSRGYVLTGSSFSMALDSRKRVIDWDILANPAQWIDCTFPYVEAPLSVLTFSTDVDSNNRAGGIEEPRIYYERTNGTLYLSWFTAASWYAINEKLAFGATEDGYLAQIRLDGFYIDSR
ncbi:hypothetical protein QCE62_06245 [Caballeronia sp. LZ033]|uniref:hypothetical protein n=1 Tax=Caballeronia sp. LZ033 TaxID=3038566 RepID=UPI00285A6FB1|nr:hypothetical protein [Caballeronia sp. LZ033]MDR5813192.1 hypothetical protein [Caballeronia sp. LZ033]